MKIRIVTVGKLKEKYWADAVEEYRKRLTRFADISIVETEEASRLPTPDAIRRKEGGGILAKLKGYVILTDLGGDMPDSEGFAALFEKARERGISEISVVIGGSHGVSEEVRKAADVRVSFGRMTYPHQLMRVIVAEQIYRAMTISAGTAYHK